MTPLFCVPDGTERGTAPPQPPGYRARPSRRAGPAGYSRRDGGRGKPSRGTVKTAPRKDTADLLAVTAEWLRRALWRSFLRHNIPGDLDTAVHAAMNVVEPVLDARDLEILRLGGLTAAGPRAGKARGRAPGELLRTRPR